MRQQLAMRLLDRSKSTASLSGQVRRQLRLDQGFRDVLTYSGRRLVSDSEELMEERVAKLEESDRDTRDRLLKIEVKLDACATREDLHRELHATTWKIIGTFAVLCAAVFWVARNVAPPQLPVVAPANPAAQASPSTAAAGAPRLSK